MRNSRFTLSFSVGLLAFIGLLIPQGMHAFSLVDDFQSYQAGAVTTTTGGVWSQVGANTLIQDENGNRFISWGANGTGARRVLGVDSLLNGTTGTYFMRVRVNTSFPDNSFGFTDVAAPTVWGDFKVQVALIEQGGMIRLGARNGASVTWQADNLAVGVWYNLWLVVNNAANTYDMYLSQGFEDGVLIGSNILYRGGAAAGDLSSAFLLGNRDPLAVSIDDLYFVSGIASNNPIPEPLELVFLQNPTDQNVLVGGDISLSASVAGGTAVREFQWQFSTDDGDVWSDVPGATGATLLIPSAQLSDTGQYRLEVISGEQVAISGVALVTVAYPAPVIEVAIEYALVSQGSSHTFSVAASGLGALSYQWRKDGQLLFETGASLTVANVQTVDVGMYSVTVFDEAGEAEGLAATSVTLTSGLSVYDPARAVFLNSGDALGASSFDAALNWSDGQAPRAGNDYYTRDILLRTPSSEGSFIFGGDQLVVNNAAQVLGTGLMYKGIGSTGVVTVDDLVLDGGLIDHASGDPDHFRLTGNLHVTNIGGAIQARQGPITISSVISGSGPLTILPRAGTSALRVLTFAGVNTFTGDIQINNNALFVLGEASVQVFKIGMSNQNNRIFGQGSGFATINGTFSFDLTDAGSELGDNWQILDVNTLNVSLGETFSVDGFTQYGSRWVSGEYIWDQTTGVLQVFDPSVPFVIEHPADAQAFVGDDVVFNSFVLSGSEVSYQWQFSDDGGETWIAIEGAESADLTIEAVSYSARGLYRFEAMSAGTSIASDSASLGLTFPDPILVVGLVDMTVREGEPFAFSVEAEGLGTLTYAWGKDGDPLAEVTNTLDLGVIAASDAGLYSLTITDDAAAAEGLVATSVTVTAALNTFSAPPVGRAIGLNFVGAASVGNAFGGSSFLGIVDSEDAAGILGTSNWNNSSSVTGVASQLTPLSLVENDGRESGTSVIWSSSNTWAAAPQGGPPGDTAKDRLFHGYIEARTSSVLGQTTVSFNAIPYPQYDVYVFVAGGIADVIGRVSLNDGSGPSYFFKCLGGAVFPRPYIQANAVTLEQAIAGNPGTFIRFAGVTGPTLTLSHNDASGGISGGIAGIAIVDTTPEGMPYPPLVTALPASDLRPAGGSYELSVTAESQNPGGVLSYQWERGDTIVGSESTLTINDLSSSDTGIYTVIITDTSSLGVTTWEVAATLVVVDAARPALVSVDMQVGAHDPMSGAGSLRTDGVVTVDPVTGFNNPTGIGTGPTRWNGLPSAIGSATYGNFVDADGLALSGLTFSISGVTGFEDEAAGGGLDIVLEDSGPLLRDYVYTTAEDIMTLTVGGLSAFVGNEVTLVVYALGKESTSFFLGSSVEFGQRNDVALVELASANNFQGLAPIATDQVEGRDLRFNNQAYAAFVGNVAGDGTVSWRIGDVSSSPGLNAFNGFQMVITNVGEHVTLSLLENWRASFFGTTENTGTTANSADYDGDGFSNLLEYALGSDPTQPGSALAAIQSGMVDGNVTLSFTHRGDPSILYQIEATNDLRQVWSVVHTYPSFSQAGRETYSDTEAGDSSQRFLRLKVTVNE